MIASLYQSGSSSAAAGAAVAAAAGSGSLIVSLGMAETENVGLTDARIEPDVIPIAAPDIARVGEQIVDGVAGRGIGRETFHQVGRDRHEAMLGVMRIQVHGDEQ